MILGQTEQCVTGSADTYAKLWSVEYGKELHSWSHKAPVRSVGFSAGESQLLTVTDQVCTVHKIDRNNSLTCSLKSY